MFRWNVRRSSRDPRRFSVNFVGGWDCFPKLKSVKCHERDSFIEKSHAQGTAQR